MFVGHFGMALAAKGLAPRASLAVLILAAQLADVIWPVLVALGIEQVMRGPLRSVPVIVCSGSDEATKLTNELQPFACLSKPLPDFGQLLEHVEAACHQST